MGNKFIGVLKHHENEPKSHRLVKSRIVGFDDLDLIAAMKELCEFTSKSSSTVSYLLERQGFDEWTLNVVEEALPKLNVSESYVHYYDEIYYTPLTGRIVMNVIKRTVNSDNDEIACEDETLCYYIDFAMYSKSSDSVTTYSITLVSTNDIKRLN